MVRSSGLRGRRLLTRTSVVAAAVVGVIVLGLGTALAGPSISGSQAPCVAAGSSLGKAKAAYAGECSAPRVDCDPIGSGWQCSSSILGSKGPAGTAAPTVPTSAPLPLPTVTVPDSTTTTAAPTTTGAPATTAAPTTTEAPTTTKAPTTTSKPAPAALDGELISHDFDDGEMGPFYPCTVKNPSYAKVVDGRIKTYWAEDGYNGARMTKGAEFCDARRGVDRSTEMRTHDQGWMGFTINVDRNHSRSSSSAVAQVFGFNDARNIFTWEGLLQLEDGDLEVVHRDCKCDQRKVYGTVVEDFVYGEDHDIVIGFKLSNQEKGFFKIWVNGRLEYSATDINFGLGDFNSRDNQTNETYTTLKLGMYNHSEGDYRNGEERIIYYDDVSWYMGTDGYDVVKPG